jgi:hypothetical protein
MTYRITAKSPIQVVTEWPENKRRRYRQFEASARILAAKHRLSLHAVADALFLFQDLRDLFEWAEANEFLPVLSTMYASPEAR